MSGAAGGSKTWHWKSIPAVREMRRAWRGRVMFPKHMYFREILPLSLKNSVSGASSLDSKPICMNEITVFLACMKKHDFIDAACLVEHKTFMDCIQLETTKTQKLKDAAKQGLLGTGERKLSAQQVNKLMQLWPQPGAQTRLHHKRRLPYQSYSDPYFIEPKDSYLKGDQ